MGNRRQVINMGVRMHRTLARWSLIFAGVLVLAALGASSAVAQPASPPWHLVQGSDGTLYVVTDQARYVVNPDPVSDDDLAALTDGGTLGSQIPATAPVVTADVWTPPPPTKTSGCAGQGGLPDTACTPGAIDPRVTQANIASTICTRGYTATVRPSTSVTDRIKREQMAAYSLQGQRLADYELDHLISLELGGAPAEVANLWPESWTGDSNAHQKDAVENYLHEQVCNGSMSLADAQRMIATDWRSVYANRGLQPAASPTD
jgi:hypothetical protein